jgi:hypothetical protein
VEFFRWKHFSSPLGRSLAFLAEVGGRAVGFAAWMPCALTVGARTVHALRGVDLGVHPDFRGRGVAAALTPAGAENAPPGTAFTMSTPNRVSRSGVLRQGRRSAGSFPLLVRLRRPLRGALGRRSPSPRPRPAVDARPAGAALADDARLEELLAEVEQPRDRLSAVKDAAFLRWRYSLPGEYHALALERAGSLDGLAILRLVRHGSSWSTRVCELLVRGNDAGAARRLLRSAVGAADVDYLACSFARGTGPRRAAARSGFLPSPRSELLLVYPLAEGLRPDPTESRSWALTLGDLELL